MGSGSTGENRRWDGGEKSARAEQMKSVVEIRLSAPLFPGFEHPRQHGRTRTKNMPNMGICWEGRATKGGEGGEGLGSRESCVAVTCLFSLQFITRPATVESLLSVWFAYILLLQ